MIDEKKLQVMITKEEMEARIKEVADQINRDYAGEELIVVGILKGAVLFFADLVRSINVDVRFDFMTISSYGNSTESTGEVKIRKDLDTSIVGKNVLIVEDIIDTGLTLTNLKELLLTRKPKSFKICCMLDKPSRRKVEIVPDYKCFDIPDEFVIGYGLDYQQEGRQIKDVCFVKHEYLDTM